MNSVITKAALLFFTLSANLYGAEIVIKERNKVAYIRGNETLKIGNDSSCKLYYVGTKDPEIHCGNNDFKQFTSLNCDKDNSEKNSIRMTIVNGTAKKIFKIWCKQHK